MQLDSKLILEFEQRLDQSPRVNVAAFIEECCAEIDCDSTLTLIGVFVEKELSNGRFVDFESLAQEFPDIAKDRITETAATSIANFTESFCPVTSQFGSLPVEYNGYSFEKEIGRGGTGVVYEAKQLSLDRRVAIKVQFISNETKNYEASILSRIEHPNILSIHDQGQMGRFPYFVSPLIRGVSLKSFCRKPPSLSPSHAAQLILEILDAVNECHCRGVVHWDLKPSNILVAEGKPIVLDFGLANSIDVRYRIRTGTPGYMAPELVSHGRSESPPLCDIFSVGVILYELLTGTKPFAFNQDSFDQPRPLNDCRSEVHPTLGAICLKAIDGKPENRFQTANSFRKEIASWLEIHTADENVRITDRFDHTSRQPSHWNSASTTIASLLALTLAIAIANFGYSLVMGSRFANDQESTRPLAQRMLVDVSVFRENAADDKVFSLGLVGEEEFVVRGSDYVKLSAELSADSYCYLFLEFITPPTEKVSTFAFPLQKDSYFQLGIQPGQQAFVLLVTDKPLDKWKNWIETCPTEIKWDGEKSVAGVWKSAGLNLIRSSVQHTERGDVVKKQRVNSSLLELIEWFHDEIDGELYSISFSVKS
jgi:serine/threonine protein kinase